MIYTQGNLIAMKTCTKCKESKELIKFYNKKTGRDGKTAKCIKCVNEQTDAWGAKNKEKVKITKKKWIDSNPEKIKSNERNWNRNNPGKKAAQVRKYQASKMQRTPSWLTNEDLKRIEAFYIESARLTKETGTPHEVDHIIPMQGKNVSGLHVPWNLRIVTRTTNRQKSNKTLSNLTL